MRDVNSEKMTATMTNTRSRKGEFFLFICIHDHVWSCICVVGKAGYWYYTGRDAEKAARLAAVFGRGSSAKISGCDSHPGELLSRTL